MSETKFLREVRMRAEEANVGGWIARTFEGREYVSEVQHMDLDDRYRQLGEDVRALLDLLTEDDGW